MKQIYTEYARYNHWANERLAGVFSALPAEAFDREIVSSFPSARRTFLHIWDAELIWLKRLQGESLTDFPSKTFARTQVEVLAGLLRCSSDFLAFTEKQPEDFFEKEMRFTTITSGGYSQRAFEMIHHCLNHSTYHRGQLVTMGRQLGLEKIPPTDMIFYLRENGKPA